MKEISLREAQEIELQILAAFDAFCAEHGLKYVIDYGTLIGAIRHKGFIPWDDDIDVTMPRPDYDRFVKLAKNHDFGNNIRVMDQKISRCPFVRLAKHGTLSVSNYRAQKHCMPFWVDIMPVDGALKNEAHQNTFNRRLEKLNAHNSAAYSRSVLESHGAKKLFFTVYNALCPNLICNVIRRLSRSHRYRSDRHGWIYCLSKITKSFPPDYFESIERVPFENITVNIPSCYDSRLTKVYGDYMTPPPAADIETHSTKYYVLD